MSLKWFFATCLLAALAVGLHAAPAMAAQKDTINERGWVDSRTFDPYKTSDLNDQKFQYQIYDSLLREEPDRSIVPALCTEYTFSEDGTEILFTIREGVKFHNGETMTADDVVFSLNTAIASPFTSKVTGTMKEAVKVDDKTVKLVLKHPFLGILGCLVSANCAIVPEKAYKANPDGFAHKPIGAGPYVLKSVKRGERMDLEAFPDYYRGPARVKNVYLRIIPDDNAALMALESGALDLMQPSQAYTDRDAIKANPRLVYHEAEQAATFLIAFNNAKGLFTDKRLREAVARAINREDLIIGAVNGMANPVEAGMIPLAPQYPKGFKALPYDLAKAKALLAEAGYPNGLTVSMRVPAMAHYVKPAEVIQEQLRQIGITMKVESIERASWHDIVYSGGNFDLTFFATTMPVIDGDFCTYPYLHSSEADGKGNNFMGIKSAELDKYLELGRKSTKPEERNAAYLKVCEIIRDESLYVPCFSGIRTMAADKDLKGVYADPIFRYYKYNYYW